MWRRSRVWVDLRRIIAFLPLIFQPRAEKSAGEACNFAIHETGHELFCIAIGIECEMSGRWR
jgi:hypothetical protein